MSRPARPEPSLRSLEHRLRAVESRLADVEGPYAETMYRTERRVVRLELFMEVLADHFDLTRPTDADVDERLDEES